MSVNIFDRISGLTFYGFYDPSKDMITVHFFNEDNSKPDIMAFLRKDMSWDVREILSEKSELTFDKEVVTIEHTPLCKYPPGSDFDKFVRKGLAEMAKQAEEKKNNLIKNDYMLHVLEKNSYN
jgi:hypothetical protein